MDRCGSIPHRVARPGLPLVKVTGSRGRSTLYLEAYVLKWHKAVFVHSLGQNESSDHSGFKGLGKKN